VTNKPTSAPLPAPTAGQRRPGSGHAWDRWAPAWHGLFALVLALATVGALTDPRTSGRDRLLVAGLAAGLAAWYWLLARGHRMWRLPLPWRLAYFAGAAAVWVPLVLLHEAYFLLAFAAYAQVFAFLPTPRSAIPGAVVLTGLMTALTAATGDGELSAVTLVVTVLSVAVGVGLALFIDAIMRESTQRHQLIAELEAARTELAGAEHQAGVLEERQRLAREIHDTLAQGFTSIVVLLEAAEAAAGPGPHPAQRYLDQARRTARDSLGEARSFVWALQPQALETATLPEALERLTERLSEETGVTARATVTGTRHPLAPDTEAALLRTAQEGLANIRKHAQANDVVLTLSYTADGVILDIRDDGRGFDPAMVADRRDGTGLGLRGMRARLAAAGGTLTVESAPGEGTTLVVELPAASEPAPARRP